MATKEDRQAVLLKILKRGQAGTQADLRRELKVEGLAVDQSTLSRDLRELGVRKSAGKYVIGEFVEGPRELDFGAAVERFTTCGPHLAVVFTGVGLAASVAVAIDSQNESAVTATLAGDDTVFIATKSRRAQAVVIRRLKTWFGDKYEQ